MKNLGIAVLGLLLFTSCNKRDNSTRNQVCISGCTIVQGRITTLNNQPVADATVKIVSHRRTSAYTGVIRNIAEVKTGSNGFYYIKFALNEYEAGPQPEAQVNIEFSYNESLYTPLLNIHKDIILSSRSAPAFSNREITLTKDFYLPLKTIANIQLQGFTNPANSGNLFYVTPLFKAGTYNNKVNGAAAVAEPDKTIVKEIPVAGNDSSWFQIARVKNGQTTYKDTSVFTPLGQRTYLTFSY